MRKAAIPCGIDQGATSLIACCAVTPAADELTKVRLLYNVGTHSLNIYGEINNSTINGAITGVGSGNHSIFIEPVAGPTLTFNGVISDGTGTVSLNAQQNGTIILTGSNSYSGGTTFSLGTNFLVTNPNGLGTGQVYIADSNLTLTLAPTINGTTPNQIVGSGSVIKNGASTLALTGSSSYTGGTTVNGGTVQITSGASLGAATSALALNNASTLEALNTLSMSRTITLGGSSEGITVDSGATVTVSGAIGGAAQLNISGPGTLVLSGSNSYSGGTVLNSGTLQLNNLSALGTTGTITLDGGTIQFSTGNTTDYSSRFSTAAGQTYSFDTNGRNVTLSSNLMSSGSTLTKLGAGTLTLSGANAFTGGINLDAGTLSLGNSNALGSIGTISFNGGTLQFTGSNVTNYTGRFSSAANQLYSFDTNGRSVTEGFLNSAGGSLTKLGTGTLLLGSNSSYTGATSVTAGILSIPSSSALTGTSGITVSSGATLQLQGNTTLIPAGLTLSDTGSGSISALDSLSGTNTYGGSMTLAAATTINSDAGALNLTNGITGTNKTLTLGGSGTGSVSGALSLSSGGLIKAGSGTWTLTGSNIYTGGTTISGGILQVGTGGTIGTLGSGGIVDNGSLVYNLATSASNPYVESNNISGSGQLTKFGSGTVTLTASNSYTGGTSVQAGTLLINQGTSLGGGAVTINPRAHLGLSLTSTNVQTVANSISGGGAVEYDGGAGGASGGGFVLTGNNSYSGGTTVNGPGFLRLTISNALGASTGNLAMNGGVLDLNRTSPTIGALTGTNGTIENNITGPFTSTLTIGNANKSGSYSGVIADGTGLGKVAIIKTGTGTLTLGGSNSYTGATTVNGGVLLVDGSIASSATTVSTGTLGGTGRLGNVSLSSGTTLMAGDTVTALNNTLTTGGLTLNLNSNLSWKLNTAIGVSDTINVLGTLTLNDANLKLADISSGSNLLTLGTQLTVLSYGLGMAPGIGAGADLFLYDGAQLLQGGKFAFGSNLYQINYSGDSDAVTLTSMGASITSPLAASATAGSHFTYTITTFSTATSFAATGLPAGLSITDGIISGTPAQAGTFNIALSAITSDGPASATLVLTIAPVTYAQWTSNFNVTGDPDDTPFNDGTCNLLKYLFDIDPTEFISPADRLALPAVGIDSTTNPGTEYLTLTYRQGLPISPASKSMYRRRPI